METKRLLIQKLSFSLLIKLNMLTEIQKRIIRKEKSFFLKNFDSLLANARNL